MSDLGASLRSLRHERKLTLTDVSSSMDISTSHLSEVERGVITPSLEMLQRLLAFYRVRIVLTPDGDVAFAPPAIESVLDEPERWTAVTTGEFCRYMIDNRDPAIAFSVRRDTWVSADQFIRELRVCMLPDGVVYATLTALKDGGENEVSVGRTLAELLEKGLVR